MVEGYVPEGFSSESEKNEYLEHSHLLAALSPKNQSQEKPRGPVRSTVEEEEEVPPKDDDPIVPPKDVPSKKKPPTENLDVPIIRSSSKASLSSDSSSLSPSEDEAIVNISSKKK